MSRIPSVQKLYKKLSDSIYFHLYILQRSELSA